MVRVISSQHSGDADRRVDALINYGKAFLRKRKYKVIAPPVMMLRDQMAKTAQLEQFDEELVSFVAL
jgi:seryl-tRNA synthetase